VKKTKKSRSKEQKIRRGSKATLLEAKRNTNVTISLARFKLSHAEIRDAIILMDLDVLSPDLLAQIIDASPTKEEESELHRFVEDGGTKEILSSASQFQLTMLKIPRLRERLKAMRFSMMFEEHIADIETALVVLEEATRQTMSSKRFRKILLIVNQLANRVNETQEKGFHLDLLQSLKSIKSNDRSCSLLDYVVNLVQKSDGAEASEFIREMYAVPSATRIDVQHIRTEIAGVSKHLSSINSLLQDSRSSKKDMFHEVMASFYTQAMGEYKAIHTRTTAAFADLDKLRGYLGFGNDIAVDELFGAAKMFMEDYLSSLKDRDTRRRILIEKNRREAMAKAIRTRRGSKRSAAK
jgi:hypothetical protein